jgi:hypothetical protein
MEEREMIEKFLIQGLPSASSASPRFRFKVQASRFKAKINAKY